MKEQTKQKISETYDKYYKLLLVIPLLFLLICIIYLINFNMQNGDIIKKDVSLTGGTTITLSDGSIDIEDLKASLVNFEVSIRQIYDLRTRQQIAVIVETPSSPEEIKQELESYLGYELTEGNSSIEFTGSSLSENFYKQLQLAIIIAFILMAAVVFFIFRTFVPGLAVILSAFADITMTLAAANFLGINFSTAGIVALLMLVGYSVDTDILLTTRVVKRKENSVNSRMYSAFKTGVTMTLTSLAAVLTALIITSTFSETLNQIFTILFIGLIFDLFNTWFTNASILKLYVEKKK